MPLDYENIVSRAVLDPTTACWLWPGAQTGKGYGAVTTRVNGKTRNFYVHRLMAWVHLSYDGDPDLEICHRCNVKLCFNPDHLYIATHAQNMKDAGRDRLMKFGKSHHATKLSVESVRQIWPDLESGLSWAKIAKKFGVATGTIQDLVEGRTWTHVSRETSDGDRADRPKGGVL